MLRFLRFLPWAACRPEGVFTGITDLARFIDRHYRLFLVMGILCSVLTTFFSGAESTPEESTPQKTSRFQQPWRSCGGR